MQIITLTTDYGTSDAYVGALKGVILSIAPTVQIVDITHDIEPHRVSHAAFVLRDIWLWYPPGTIHLVVVDPGVGTDRRILLGQYDQQFIPAPDNGIVTFVHREQTAEAVYVVENRKYFLPQLSNTFHGRDVMAPVAAHLANGVNPREFGRLTDHVEMLSLSYRAEVTDEGIRGSVIHVDRFGNLITNIHENQLGTDDASARQKQVKVNNVNIGLVRTTFSDVSTGEPLAIIGGSGLVEIAVNRGRAIDHFGVVDSILIENLS